MSKLQHVVLKFTSGLLVNHKKKRSKIPKFYM